MIYLRFLFEITLRQKRIFLIPPVVPQTVTLTIIYFRIGIRSTKGVQATKIIYILEIYKE